jgi:hypothetical protein
VCWSWVDRFQMQMIPDCGRGLMRNRGVIDVGSSICYIFYSFLCIYYGG